MLDGYIIHVAKDVTEATDWLVTLRLDLEPNPENITVRTAHATASRDVINRFKTSLKHAGFEIKTSEQPGIAFDFLTKSDADTAACQLKWFADSYHALKDAIVNSSCIDMAGQTFAAKIRNLLDNQTTDMIAYNGGTGSGRLPEASFMRRLEAWQTYHVGAIVGRMEA